MLSTRHSWGEEWEWQWSTSFPKVLLLAETKLLTNDHDWFYVVNVINNDRSGETSSQTSPTGDARRRPSSVSISCTMPGLQVSVASDAVQSVMISGAATQCA